MKISEIGEFGFIERVHRAAGRARYPVILGIGDDASILRPEPGYDLLVTTDMLVEGVHFLRETTPPGDLGFKSLTVNLSDIAAMGGTPIQAYLSLALTPDTKVEELDHFIDGFLQASGGSVQLSGGDTVSSKAGWAVSVTVIGTVKEGRALRRDSAAAGDVLFLSGPTGESAAGLALLLGSAKLEDDVHADQLIQAHNRPAPELALGKLLSDSDLCSCALDVSDGLLQDLTHICRASSVGACIYLENIPLTPALKNAAESVGVDQFFWPLTGGEDYRLLFTAPEENAAALTAILSDAGIKAVSIGVIEEGESVRAVKNGIDASLPEKGGHDHFRNV